MQQTSELCLSPTYPQTRGAASGGAAVGYMFRPSDPRGSPLLFPQRAGHVVVWVSRTGSESIFGSMMRALPSSLRLRRPLLRESDAFEGRLQPCTMYNTSD